MNDIIEPLKDVCVEVSTLPQGPIELFLALATPHPDTPSFARKTRNCAAAPLEISLACC